jgi:hypothetical protein
MGNTSRRHDTGRELQMSHEDSITRHLMKMTATRLFGRRVPTVAPRRSTVQSEAMGADDFMLTLHETSAASARNQKRVSSWQRVDRDTCGRYTVSCSLSDSCVLDRDEGCNFCCRCQLHGERLIKEGFVEQDDFGRHLEGQ